MDKKETFEATLLKLEEIVDELESGTPDLDKMLKLFEKGMKLTKLCKKKLDLVEQRISTIVKVGDQIVEKPGMPK